MNDDEKKIKEILIGLNPEYSKCCRCSCYYHKKNTDEIISKNFNTESFWYLFGSRCFLCGVDHGEQTYYRITDGLLKRCYPDYYTYTRIEKSYTIKIE